MNIYIYIYIIQKLHYFYVYPLILLFLLIQNSIIRKTDQIDEKRAREVITKKLINFFN
jgi:hypothetical protein